MARVRSKSANTIYQLKVSLNYLNPLIWRQLLVHGNTTLAELHHILQILMGWQGHHMHQFTIGRFRYSDPSFELEGTRNQNPVRLKTIARQVGKEFLYEYDFGDSWEVKIVVENILPPEKGELYPRCVYGEFASPPEDSGGAPGYSEFAQAILDPEHPEHKEMRQSVGQEFDPFVFDMGEVNRRLKQL
ncbi:MAG: plasmid pRiA4b ORF-3 family protein [Ardenticatenaceae bacterium]